MNTFDKDPDYPPLGFEQHTPNYALAIICLIGVGVYIAAIAGFCIGAAYILDWIAKHALGI